MIRLVVVAGLVCGTAFAQSKPVEQKPAGVIVQKPQQPVDDPWANRNDLFVPPTTHTTTKVALGDVQRFSLPNGLSVISVARHSAPIIDVTVEVRIEDTAEPLDKTGLAEFVASMLRKGTAKRTADQLSEQIDTAGAELDASASRSGVFVSCRGRSRDLTLCLDMVSDVLLHPTFPADEMDEVRSQLIASVEQTQDNSGVLADEHADNLFFGDHDQRGRRVSKRTAAAIDHDSLLAFYKAWFHPNHSIIAVSGDFDPKSLRTSLGKWFGGWKQGEVPKSTALAMPMPGPMKIRLVDRPDLTQSQIVIMGPGIRHADPDLCAVRLMNYTLGEGAFSSRLMKVVRSENAKTYGASTHFEANRTAGPFQATTFTREAETAATIKLVLSEIDKMKRSGPTAVELAAAKANLIGGYGLQFQTATDVAEHLIIAADDDLPPDFISTYPACLDQVTLAQAAAAASAHLSPQALVVVGNAAKVGPQLTAAKLAPTETVSYTDPISASERSEAKAQKDQAKQAAANATPTEVEEGKKLLKLALAAKGVDSLAKVVDLHVLATAVVTVQNQRQNVDLEAWYVPAKGQAREDMTSDGLTQSTVLDGQKGFAKQNTNVIDLPPKMLASGKRDLWGNGNFVILNAAQPGVQVRALPPVVDGKNKYDVLNVVTTSGDSVEIELDQKTHHVVKVAWVEDGQPSARVFTDYRNDGGIFFPHHVTQIDGPMRMDFSVDKITVNKGVPGNTFNR